MIWNYVLPFYLTYTSYSQLFTPISPEFSQMPTIIDCKFWNLEHGSFTTSWYPTQYAFSDFRKWLSDLFYCINKSKNDFGSGESNLFYLFRASNSSIQSIKDHLKRLPCWAALLPIVISASVCLSQTSVLLPHQYLPLLPSPSQRSKHCKGWSLNKVCLFVLP